MIIIPQLKINGGISEGSSESSSVSSSLSSSISSSLSNSPSASLSASPSQGMPDDIVKMIFLHHSTGGNLIADTTGSDGKGGLGNALDDNNYFLSDTCYEWDAPNNPDIGSYTDIGHWYSWFISSDVMNAVYTEYDKDAFSVANYGDRTRDLIDPTGENKIIMIKSCYPNADVYSNNDTVPSDLYGQPYNATAGGQNVHTLANCMAVYERLYEYMSNRTDKMFVVMINPPLSSGNTTPERATNMRALATWLRTQWLQAHSWENRNIYVYDLYNVLTDVDNHHTVDGGVEYHHTEVDSGNYLVYPSGDDHPNGTGNRKVTAEFVPLLNMWYESYLGASFGSASSSVSASTSSSPSNSASSSVSSSMSASASTSSSSSPSSSISSSPSASVSSSPSSSPSASESSSSSTSESSSSSASPSSSVSSSPSSSPSSSESSSPSASVSSSPSSSISSSPSSSPSGPPEAERLVIIPSRAMVAFTKTKQFVATLYDQYGDVYDAEITWSVSGGGTINSSGLFTAGEVAADFVVTASYLDIEALAVIRVVKLTGNNRVGVSVGTGL